MKKVIFVASAGGHLAQLLQLAPTFKHYKSLLITEKNGSTGSLSEKYDTRYLVHGTRKHLQSYLFIFSWNIIKSIWFFLRFNPDVIVTTGTHTAVPLCYIAWLFRRKIIFIESFSKQHSKNLSGRMVYPIASTFVVQWESMKELYPKAECWGWIY